MLAILSDACARYPLQTSPEEKVMLAILSGAFRILTRIPAWFAVALSIAVVLAGCGRRCATVDSLDLPKRRPVRYVDRIVFDGRPLAIIGDTQRTSWPECVFAGRRVEDRKQQVLIRSLAAAQPGALVIVGDMVFRASDPEHWSYFDELMAPIRQANTPVLALMGNHEYSGDDEDARSLVNQRFLRLRAAEYYVEQYGRLGLIFLNSNKDKLDADVWDGQLDWFRDRLQSFDRDDNVDGILVFLHHPPFTKSRVVDDDREMAMDFVDGFSRARKSLAMISGHAHGYECTRTSGKYYIVTAGGGGPLQPRDGFAVCPDHKSGTRRPNSSAFFNYLLVHQSDKGIRIDVRGLAEGESSVKRLATLEIPFARGTKSSPPKVTAGRKTGRQPAEST